jgi:thymidylate synthase (FAD)
MNVRLIAKTEGLIGTEYAGKSLDEMTVGIARLSSSREINDLFTEPEKLLRHCILNQHWSVFDSTNLTFEIITSRDIGREYLRHKSLFPAEFSARYAQVMLFEDIELRVQSKNNRQSSLEVFNPTIGNSQIKGSDLVTLSLETAIDCYDDLLKSNTSRETARFVLPGCAQTKIIFNGTLRSWITTLNARLHHTAQKEARLIAEAIRDEFINQCPIISQALYNFDNAYNVHILDRIVLEKFKVYNLIDKKYLQ